jgi:hypothetical protein
MIETTLHGWDINIKMDLSNSAGRVWSGLMCIRLDKWWALVKMVVYLHVP